MKKKISTLLIFMMMFTVLMGTNVFAASLTCSIATPAYPSGTGIVHGNSVAVKVTANGSVSDTYQYSLTVIRLNGTTSSGTVSSTFSYQTTNVFVWTPLTQGNYELIGYVKDITTGLTTNQTWTYGSGSTYRFYVIVS